MTRGLFNNILSIPAYQNASKHWHITLEHSTIFWYDLVVDPIEKYQSKQFIIDYLKDLKNKVDATLEKRFIYFYLARKKVRFNTKKQPRYSLFKNKLIINLVIGNNKRKKIVIPSPLFYLDQEPIRPEVFVDEKFIHFQIPNYTFILSVHDLLKNFNIPLGIVSEVLYVGITEDPSKRPIERKHRGYSDAIYFTPTSENDIFLVVNAFKVIADATTNYGIRFISANSMTDEVPVGKEGEIIEQALIHYFDTKSQKIDQKNSSGKFKSLLKNILQKKNINAISMHLELEPLTEYDILGSEKIEANATHIFSWELVNEQHVLKKFNSYQELSLHYQL